MTQVVCDTGPLGVILWSASTRRLPVSAARENLRQLFGSSLWVSPKIRQEALAFLDEL